MGSHAEYAEQARKLGQALSKRNIELIYGGGSIGLMGALASSVDENGGVVHSIIPKPLIPYSGKIIQPNRCIISLGMHDRKRKFVELADAFIALPGGLGTFEELCETATWRQLGVHKKPFGVLNIRNFFDPLRSLFSHAIKEGFLDNQWIDGGIFFDDDVEGLLDKIMIHLQKNLESQPLTSSNEWVI